jgi:hypothetical protein
MPAVAATQAINSTRPPSVVPLVIAARETTLDLCNYLIARSRLTTPIGIVDTDSVARLKLVGLGSKAVIVGVNCAKDKIKKSH